MANKQSMERDLQIPYNLEKTPYPFKSKLHQTDLNWLTAIGLSVSLTAKYDREMESVEQAQPMCVCRLILLYMLHKMDGLVMNSIKVSTP